MRRVRTKIVLAIATAGVVVAMVGSASAVPHKCVVKTVTVKGNSVTVTVCV